MKKLLSILMMSVLVTGTLAGCAAKAPVQTPAETPETKTEEPVSGAIGTKESPVKVSIILKDVSPEEEDVKSMVKAIEEAMAKENKFIKLEYLEAPTGTYKEVVPLAFRTGQISPDIIYFQGGDLAISNDGMLEDLTSYIEKSVNIKNVLEDQSKEKIKNYPYLLWLAPARVPTPVMRKDFAEKLDSYKEVVANPTVENYEKMLNEIVTKGIAKYAITSDGDMTRMNTVFNHAFGVTGTILKEDGKWKFSMASTAEKNKLEFYARLYKAGLIDPEYITKQWDAMEKSFYEGEAAFLAGTAGKVIDIYNNKMVQTHGEAAQLVVLPPAKGVSQGYTSVDITKESRGFAINAGSKVKDAAFAVLDFMAGPEGMKIDKLGILGTHYTVDTGKIVFTEKFPEWWPRFWETLNTFKPTPELAAPVMSEPALTSLDMVNEFYKKDTNVLIPDHLTSQWDAMVALYKEYSSDIIRGVRPVSDFDEFVTKWNEAGGTEFDAYLTEKLGK